MSMNIYISAEREVVTTKSGIKDTQVITFDCWQTPTKVTYQILETDNPLQAYMDWVMEQSEDYSTPDYADNDIFCKGPIIGHTVYNPAKDHVKDLKAWVDEVSSKDYTVNVEII